MINISLETVIIACVLVVVAAGLTIYLEEGIKYHFQKKLLKELLKETYKVYYELGETIANSFK